MKEFVVKTEKEILTFEFPTNFNELTEKYLADITANVTVAPYYTLVGLVYVERLGSIILTRKQNKKDMKSPVIPIFIKAGATDSDFIKNANLKDKLIISSTQLGLGHHVSCPKNTLSLDYFIKCIDEDTTLFNRYKNFFGNEYCYFVEFKLVPNADIVGLYSNKSEEFENPYITIDKVASEGTNN